MPFALEAGVDVRDYWYYTPLELNQTMAAYKARLASTAKLIHLHADLTSLAVGRMLSKDIKFPPAHEVFPDLISEPERPQAAHWKLSKARLMNYAASHNEKRRKEVKK